MKTVRDHRKKAARRAGRTKTPVLSTSEARANFAEALETAQVDNAVIGFDRYGRTVAALVPVEAIYMLAGLGKLIDPGTRQEIEEGAMAFAHSVPFRKVAPEAVAAAARPRAKTARNRPAAKKQSASRRPRG
jgi:hypothetical protein